MFCVPQLTLASTRLAGIATTMFLIERLLPLLLPQLLLQLLLLQHASMTPLNELFSIR